MTHPPSQQERWGPPDRTLEPPSLSPLPPPSLRTVSGQDVRGQNSKSALSIPGNAGFPRALLQSPLWGQPGGMLWEGPNPNEDWGRNISSRSGVLHPVNGTTMGRLRIGSRHRPWCVNRHLAANRSFRDPMDSGAGPCGTTPTERWACSGRSPEVCNAVRYGRQAWKRKNLRTGIVLSANGSVANQGRAGVRRRGPTGTGANSPPTSGRLAA